MAEAPVPLRQEALSACATLNDRHLARTQPGISLHVQADEVSPVREHGERKVDHQDGVLQPAEPRPRRQCQAQR